jgi:hypothetical protein
MMAGTTSMTTDAAISVVPANEASWDDLQTVFGTRGDAATCQCERYKLRPREAFKSFPVEVRADRLRRQTNCGHRKSGTTSGLVAYLDGEPVGWCAVAAHARRLPAPRRQPRVRPRRSRLR